jgi:hypothetical protein
LASRELKVVIAGDAAGLLSALNRSGRAVRKFSNDADRGATRTQRLSHAVGKGFKVAGLAAIPVVGLLAYQLHGAVSAAAEAETAQINLGQAMRVAHIDNRKFGQGIENTIQRLSLMSGIDDELVSGGMAQFIRATGDQTEAQKLLSIAVDLSRAKQIDLGAATKTVLTIQAGSYRALKQLGIKYTEITPAQDKLARSTGKVTDAQRRQAKQSDYLTNKQRVLNVLQGKLRGSATAYGKTASGSLDRLNVVFENMQEIIGGALLPTIKDLADRFSKWLLKAQKTGQIKRIVKGIQEKLVDAKNAVADVYDAFVSVKRVVETLTDDVETLIAAIDRIPSLPGGAGWRDFIPGGQLIPGGSADGTPYWGGGPRWVNERGPELLARNGHALLFDMPSGYSVHRASDTSAMLGRERPINVKQYFSGMDPRVAMIEAERRFRRLRPHAISV